MHQLLILTAKNVTVFTKVRSIRQMAKLGTFYIYNTGTCKTHKSDNTSLATTKQEQDSQGTINCSYLGREDVHIWIIKPVKAASAHPLRHRWLNPAQYIRYFLPKQATNTRGNTIIMQDQALVKELNF